MDTTDARETVVTVAEPLPSHPYRLCHEVSATRQSGLQVPVGTCESRETPSQAVLREAQEETGLVALRIVRYLGDADYDMRPYANAVHHRHSTSPSMVRSAMSGATSNNTAEPNNRRRSGSSGYLLGRLADD